MKFSNLALTLFLIAGTAHAEVVERIIAIVNEEVITQSDVTRYTERIRSGGLTDDLLIPDEETKQSLLKDRQKLLQKMIDEKLINSEVKKQNLSVPLERVEQEIRKVAKNNGVSREELKGALRERGIDFAEYQDFIKTGLERQGLVEKGITSRIKISEDDVMAQYAIEHGTSTEQAYEYTLAYMYFASSKGGAAAAKARAEEALKKLRDGAVFEKLAAEVSEDPNFEQGALLGVFKTGELQRDLDLAVQKLTVGEWTPALATNGGFQIVKVTKKRLIPDPRTEKDRERIRAVLYEKAFKKQLANWLEQLRQEAFIRINLK